MIAILAIGIGAGLVSALMTLSITSGGILALALSYLAILPLLVAGLGWGHLTAALGLCAGGVLLSAGHSPVLALMFAAATGVPAWVLCLIAEKSARAGRHVPSDLLMGAAAIASAFAIGVVFYIGGFDHGLYQDTMRAAVSRIVKERGAAGSTVINQGEDVIAFIAAAMAYMMAIGWVFLCVINLYIAGRIVKASHKLFGSWPDLAATRLPKEFGLLMALCATLGFVANGFLAHAASLILAAGIAALAIAGLALIHALTKPLQLRALILVGIYALIGIFALPLVVIALLGLADTQYDLRSRINLSNLN